MGPWLINTTRRLAVLQQIHKCSLQPHWESYQPLGPFGLREVQMWYLWIPSVSHGQRWLSGGPKLTTTDVGMRMLMVCRGAHPCINSCSVTDELNWLTFPAPVYRIITFYSTLIYDLFAQKSGLSDQTTNFYHWRYNGYSLNNLPILSPSDSFFVRMIF